MYRRNEHQTQEETVACKKERVSSHEETKSLGLPSGQVENKHVVLATRAIIVPPVSAASTLLTPYKLSDSYVAAQKVWSLFVRVY